VQTASTRRPPPEPSDESDGDDEPMAETMRKMHAVRAVKFLNYSLREAARAYGLTSTTLHRLVHAKVPRSRNTSSLSEKRSLLYSMTTCAVALSKLRDVKPYVEDEAPEAAQSSSSSSSSSTCASATASASAAASSSSVEDGRSAPAWGTPSGWGGHSFAFAPYRGVLSPMQQQPSFSPAGGGGGDAPWLTPGSY
jgi:hypothetical protein